ncbi:MAG: ABC transporter permease [Planctomycetota bacterium]
MGLTLSLIYRHALARKVRTVLTVLAVALSVALVVGVTSGYKSMEASARALLLEMMGSEDIRVQPTRLYDGLLPASLPRELLDHPDFGGDLASALGRLKLTQTVESKETAVRADVVGLRPDDDKAAGLPVSYSVFEDIPKGSNDGRIKFSAPDAREAYVDVGLANNGLEPNDELLIPVGDELVPFRVVGYVHKPAIVALAIRTAYVPLGALQGPNEEVSEVLINLKPGRDVESVAAKLQAHLGEKLEVRVLRADREELDKNLRSTELLSVLGGSVAMVAGTFIVFTTLSMGVAERQRTLAMLRAIGAERRQVGALVIVEGVVLGFVGVVLGIPLGIVGLEGIAWAFSDVMSEGVVLSWIGIAAAAVGMTLAGVVAAVLPALRAMRLDPLEAMAPSASGELRMPWGLVVLGLVLAGFDSFLLFSPDGNPIITAFGLASAYEKEVRFYGHLVLGLPALMFGFFLVAPAFVWGVERTANIGVNLGRRHALMPIIGVLLIALSLAGGWLLMRMIAFDTAAALLGVVIAIPAFFGVTCGLGMIFAGVFRRDFELLRQQLTGSVWRAAGTASGLMVGLSVLVVMQIQGGSALRSWQLPDGFPDVFVYTLTRTVAFEDEQVEQIAALPEIGVRDDGAPAVLPIYLLSPNLPDLPFALAGLRMPENTTFVGCEPGPMLDMLQLDFVEGNEADARVMLEQDGHVLVTEEFRRLKGLGVGDVFELATEEGPVDFIVAGVVRSPGIDVIVATFDMRGQFEQQAAACIFGSANDARNIFKEDRARILAVNLQPGVEREVAVQSLRRSVGRLRANIADVRAIKETITGTFARIMLLATTVAWAAMFVAALGVTNTILASVRSRRWQFGLLRSLGVTRGGLLKLVVAEAALLGVVAVILGLTCGGLIATNGRRVTQMVIGFVPPLSFPWELIAIGIGVVMAVSVFAAMIPAIRVARADPLGLLQGGRSAS